MSQPQAALRPGVARCVIRLARAYTFCQSQRMKLLIALALFAALLRPDTAAAKDSAIGRTITDIDVIPTSVLQRSISPKFYKSLLISPIKGFVVVRGNLSGTHLSGARVVRSEPNGANDHLALQRA